MDAVIIQCLGAAETVTGSKHLLKTPGLNILVDCGLFQGVFFSLTKVDDITYTISVEGNLELAGITKIATVHLTIKINSDGSLKCTSQKTVKMSDYNVALGNAEARIMRVEDEVKLNFDLVLSKISQEL